MKLTAVKSWICTVLHWGDEELRGKGSKQSCFLGGLQVRWGLQRRSWIARHLLFCFCTSVTGKAQKLKLFAVHGPGNFKHSAALSQYRSQLDWQRQRKENKGQSNSELRNQISHWVGQGPVLRSTETLCCGRCEGITLWCEDAFL